MKRNTWQQTFELFKQHIKTNKEYPTKVEKLTLYNWINYQRVCYHKQILSTDKIEKLNSVEFIWQPKAQQWQQNFIQFQHYYHENNRYPQLSSQNEQCKRLALWVNSVRLDYRKGKLTNSQLEQLLQLKFNFNPQQDSWQKKYSSVVEFMQDSETFPQSSKNKLENSLYNWCKLQAMSFQLQTLAKNKLFLLKSINFEKFIEDLPKYEKVPIEIVKLSNENE